MLGGPHMPHQAPKSSCGRPTSAMVGISGASVLRLVPVTAIARTLPARTIGSSARIASIISGMCPPTTSFSGRRRAAIGNDRHVGAGVLIERDLREMAGRAELRGRERPRLGVLLGRGDDLGQRLLRPVVGDDQHQRRVAGERDRREIGERIVGRVLQHQPRDVVGRGVEQHGVAVRRGALHVEAADRAVAAGAVLDDERDVALGLGLGGDQAREGVDAAARRHRHDDADGAVGEAPARARRSARAPRRPRPASSEARHGD